ncbi:MAG TPA: class I SAM-dependent methyltransferase [Kineosporiaceae bacterium]|nr:class I SAM-dependent methyltransferase [Kineosporiaceae bacterium]
MDDKSKIPVALTGVPETLLWTLYYRAQEAERPDSVLPDPLAVELVRRIDYPFAERLGAGAGRAQWQGLRARTFDHTITRFLAANPGGTVVALGEGLETQFWRVDDGRVRWFGVDLPEAATTRAQILPGHERHRQIDASVLDDTWMDEVDPTRAVLITAQGLLMYLPRAQVHDLLTRCARQFPGAQLVFDGVPRWTSAVTRAAARKVAAEAAGKTAAGKLMAPPMPWSMDHREATVLGSLPGIRSVERLHPPRGRGALYAYALPLADRLVLLRSLVLSIWSIRFE